MKHFPLLLLCLFTAACTGSKSASTQDATASCLPGIIDGRAVSSTDPYGKKVALLVVDGGYCTATPISRNVLITAAHCVHGRNRLRVVFANEINCATGTDLQPQTRNVIASRVDEAYDEKVFQQNDVSKLKHDVALIKIENTIPEGYKVTPLYDGQSPIDNDDLVLVGFGDPRENAQEMPRLRRITKSLRGSISRTSEPQQLMLDQKDQGGICQGDSGGPQFVRVHGQDRILGVNSAVINAKDKALCHDSAVIMYAPYFADWVKQKLVELR
jgi:V8-like Glu-specific endopeptidase